PDGAARNATQEGGWSGCGVLDSPLRNKSPGRTYFLHVWAVEVIDQIHKSPGVHSNSTSFPSVIASSSWYSPLALKVTRTRIPENISWHDRRLAVVAFNVSFIAHINPAVAPGRDPGVEVVLGNARLRNAVSRKGPFEDERWRSIRRRRRARRDKC